jgi:hypothetical protein
MVRSRAQTEREQRARTVRSRTEGPPDPVTGIFDLIVVIGLSGICAVPVVREDLETGVDTHPYLQPALDTLDDGSPVTTISVSLRASAEMI